MKRVFIVSALVIFSMTCAAYMVSAAPSTIFQRNLLPETTNLYDLGSTTPDKVWAHLYVQTVCLTADSCRTTWPSGSGSAGDIFTHPSYGGSATTSLMTLSGGLISVGSTTVVGNATTTGMQGVGSLFINGQLFSNLLGSGLSNSAGALTVSGLSTSNFSSANISQWTNNSNYITLASLSASAPLSYNNGSGAFTFNTFSPSTLAAFNTSGVLIATTTAGIASFNASSTSATSTIAWGLDVGASGGCISFAGTCLQTFIQNAAAYKSAANYATAAVLPGTPTYSNGASGVGATLTEVGFGALVVDGQTVTLGQRILVKNEVDQTTNGVYIVSTVGSVIANYVLTRSTDYNTSNDIYAGTTVPVLAGGTANGDTQWTESTTGTIVIGTSNITFIETSYGTAGTVTSVAASVPTFLSISGSPITTSGTLAISYSGTALPVANGGTNATSLSSHSILTFNGTSVIGSSTPAAANFIATSSTNSVFPNFTSSFSTTTNATTTNLFSTTASSTNLFSALSTIGTLTLGNALTVANGGTGAKTLTGCLTGNGTGAITGSGTCNTSSATVSSIAAGLGLTGGTITTSGTLGLISYIATGTAETAGQLAAWNTTSGTPAKLYSVATSAPSFSGGLTTTGTAGAWVGGSSYAVTLANANANSVLGCIGASCTPTSVATSSLFNGTTGQVPYFSGTGALVGTSSLFISTAGQVGIGTTTPAWNLQVAGTRPGFALSDSSAAANKQHWVTQSEGGNLYVGTSTDAYATTTPPLLTYTPTGRIGINMAAPLATLHTYDGTTAGIPLLVDSKNAFTDIEFKNTNNSNGYIDYTNGDFNIYANSPTVPSLTVKSGAPGNTSVAGGLLIAGSGNITLNSNFLSGDGGNEGVSVDAAGLVTVTSLTTAGAVTMSGLSSDAGTRSVCTRIIGGAISLFNGACGTSDSRVKTNVTDLTATQGLAAVMKLRPVNFNWLDPRMAALDGPQIGLLAQDVQKLFPQIVNSSGTTTIEDANGNPKAIPDTLSVDYAKLVAPLITAFQQVVLHPMFGTPQAPTGITLYDDVDGQPYCVREHGGQLTNQPGACP